MFETRPIWICALTIIFKSVRRDRRVNIQETDYLAESGGRTHGENRLLWIFGRAFLPFGIFTNGIFTIWHFYQCHFYHLTFSPMTFLPSGIFTYGIFTNGIFTYGNLTYGIFTNGIFTAHPRACTSIDAYNNKEQKINAKTAFCSVQRRWIAVKKQHISPGASGRILHQLGNNSVIATFLQLSQM